MPEEDRNEAEVAGAGVQPLIAGMVAAFLGKFGSGTGKAADGEGVKTERKAPSAGGPRAARHRLSRWSKLPQWLKRTMAGRRIAPLRRLARLLERRG